jgi:ketosteroid isomerase-like protein
MTIRIHRVLIVAGAAAAALGLAACQPKSASVDTAKAADEIRQSEISWSAEMAEKSPTKAVAHYAPDALLADPMGPAAHNAKDIEAAFAEGFKDPAFTLKFAPEHVTVAKSGDLAYSTGTFDVTFTDPATKKPGKGSGVYVTVYTKGADGKWKASADFAHMNPPPEH